MCICSFIGEVLLLVSYNLLVCWWVFSCRVVGVICRLVVLVVVMVSRYRVSSVMLVVCYGWDLVMGVCFINR